MQNTFKTLLEARISANYFNPDRPVETAVIEELVRLATLAPSAYNFQNWKFIAVQSESAKTLLHGASYGQSKVMDAPVTFVVCGLLHAHKRLKETMQPSVDAGLMGQAAADSVVVQASQSHENDSGLQRDEAIRSASLATMVLIMAATSMGLASCPVGGFDTEALVKGFALDANELPVMLVTVGYAAPGNWPQKLRRPVGDVLVHA